MPIHDWTRVDAGTFHDFHQGWTIEIRRALNGGILPSGYFAMADQRISGPEPDVVTFQTRVPSPAARGETEAAIYARKANRIAVRHPRGRVVAMIEVVSPGNKGSRSALRSFVEKTVEFLRQGVHVLVIDLFPPSARDPQGIHKAIWDEIEERPFELPPDKPLTLAAYVADDPITAYVEPLAVGDRLPDMPLFLEPGVYVPTPLEATYEASWAVLPDVIRELVEPPGG